MNKLYEQDDYFIIEERPTRKGHPYAFNNRLTLLVKKTRFNEHGEHHHGVKWVASYKEGKEFIEKQIEKN